MVITGLYTLLLCSSQWQRALNSQNDLAFQAVILSYHLIVDCVNVCTGQSRQRLE